MSCHVWYEFSVVRSSSILWMLKADLHPLGVSHLH